LKERCRVNGLKAAVSEPAGRFNGTDFGIANMMASQHDLLKAQA
jgi:hypothetical protein